MKNKFLQLLILFCFACFSVARAGEVFVGAATTASSFLPSNCYYNYSMTQQIYTADEIGTSGLISSISFYCTTCSANRTLDIYLVSTEKTTFSNSTDWITVSTADKVFSGDVALQANQWNTIVFNTPFEYDGIHNLAVIVDDNKGSFVNPYPYFNVYESSNGALCIYSDETNFNPLSPSSNNGTVLNSKNAIKLDITPTLTVYDDTTDNNTVPAYIYYFEQFTRSQFVIPAGELAEMMGTPITSMTFYTSSSNIPYTTVSPADVYLKEVNYTSISAYEPKSSATIVYSGYFDIVSTDNGGKMTINFSTPYTYRGGNLIVGIENTDNVNYKTFISMVKR